MPTDYDALSDVSELTGDDSASDHHDEDDEETMASAPRTPSKKRRRVVRAMRDEDEDEEDEVADALVDEEDDDAEEEDADELDEDDEEYDAPSSSRRGATRSSGRKAAAVSTPKRSARTSARTAVSTLTASTGKKSLRVKLTRTPNSASAATAAAAATPKDDSPPAPKPRPSRSAAAPATASTPPSRRAKDTNKVKWKPRGKAKDFSDNEDDQDLRAPEEDELDDDDDDDDDDEDMDVSRAAAVDDADVRSASGSDSDSSELDEATAAEMQAIIGKTARQLAREGGVESEHMELPMFDPNRKKKLTENELALRRSETARKRKNQVEKKLEDDKVETINRLLKKQVGRSRNKLPRAGSAEESDEEAELARKRGRDEMSRKALKEMPAPFFRYIDRADGKLLAVPTGPPLIEELLGANYVHVNQALIEQLDTPIATDGLSEKATAHEEKARKRLEAQTEAWAQDRALDQVWGHEGLYEYQLRTVLGQSRKDWIGSRRPPTPEQEEQPHEEEDAEAEGEGEGEQQEEDQDEEAADDAEDDQK
ncbi:conserved hypothetical protein [Sporisorium reilianum SRZ2]|uniref:INO80 complex subunit B-like conserved region domain-containing protein n=1 Tax=Sporisorium reilianum (strain SRZ2) TaxID=999809 RepID=E6ZN29_SPORE|nr:conserved hypothetical protein [Sporisorium reilianum SRZ2]